MDGYVKSRTAFLRTLLVNAVLFITGCGGYSYEGTDLSGQVTIGGQPVETGMLQFVPVEGDGTVVSADIQNGTYSAQRVPVGKVRVMVFATKPTGETELVHDVAVPKIVSIVPEKYQDGLEQEVRASDSKLDISLDGQ